MPLKHALSLSLSLVPPPFPAIARPVLTGWSQQCTRHTYTQHVCIGSPVYTALCHWIFLGAMVQARSALLQQVSSLTPSGLPASARRRELDGFVPLFVSGEKCNCEGGRQDCAKIVCPAPFPFFCYLSLFSSTGPKQENLQWKEESKSKRERDGERRWGGWQGWY